MAIKDFSILMEKIETARTKKDISVVSGFNAITQYIEHILKTQKGELISNMSLGSDYFTYVYGTNDVGVLELSLAAYIQAAIVKLNNVKVKLLSQSNQFFQFQVTFSLFDGIKYQDNVSCLIEVEL
jgi:hypothetical protein